MRVYHDQHGRYRGFSYGPVGLAVWLFVVLCLIGVAIMYPVAVVVLVVLWLAVVGWRAQRHA